MSGRYSRWDRSGMPDSAANYAIQKGIDQTMRSVIQDTWARPISKSASMLPPERQQDQTPRVPSGGTVPITSPPGIEHIDRMIEAQTRREQLIAAQQAAELKEIERRINRHDPYKAKTSYDPLKRFDNEVPSFHRDKEK